MRVIEQKMIKAIREKKNFDLSNTSVVNTRKGLSVYLFRNIIAEITDSEIKIFPWGSSTTRSRLNALLDELTLGEERTCLRGYELKLYNTKTREEKNFPNLGRIYKRS